MISDDGIPEQGEIWWIDQGLDKRRPALVITRSAAIPRLRSIVVAPITRSVRDVPTHLSLGAHEGLPYECAAAFDDLRTVPIHEVSKFVGRLDLARDRICDALSAMADC